MYDVICVGSSTVDVFARTNFSQLIKICDPRGEHDLLAYPCGTKIIIDDLNMTVGGGGTNTTVALARLGHKVAYLGKMGTHTNSKRIIELLQKENVDTSLVVRTKNGRTGYSIILDSIEHDRTILTFKGSNNDLRFSEIPKKKLRTKWFYFASMMEEAYGTLEKLALYAKKNNIGIMFNPSSYLCRKGLDYLRTLLKQTDILALNREEAEMLLGTQDNSPDRHALLYGLHTLGPSLVIITDGKKGTYLYTAEEHAIYRLTPRKIKPVETTGAGDAFGSTFLSGWMRTHDARHSLHIAQINAESEIMHPGVKNKLLTTRQMAVMLKTYKVKITRKKAP